MMHHAMRFWRDVWLESCENAVRLGESMVAAPVIVNRRLAMMDTAARDPSAAPCVELYNMVAEKIEAAMLAAMSLGHDCQAIQAEMLRLPGSSSAATASSMRVGRLALGAVGRAMAPVHARVAANAKRLKRHRRTSAPVRS